MLQCGVHIVFLVQLDLAVARTDAMKALRAEAEVSSLAESTNRVLLLRVLLFGPFVVLFLLLQELQKQTLDIRGVFLNRRILRINQTLLPDFVEL